MPVYPFARSLGGVVIPAGITTVTIQAHDSVLDKSDQVARSIVKRVLAMID